MLAWYKTFTKHTDLRFNSGTVLISLHHIRWPWAMVVDAIAGFDPFKPNPIHQILTSPYGSPEYV